MIREATKKVVRSVEVSLSSRRWVRGCDRVLKNKTIEVKAETKEEEVRERRGVRWM